MEWMEFEDKVRELAGKINKVDYTPDAVVYVERGGETPARVLASYLKVDDIRGIKVKKDGDKRRFRKTQEEAGRLRFQIGMSKPARRGGVQGPRNQREATAVP